MAIPPVKIKYSTAFHQNCVKAKDFVLGINNSAIYGPTSTTGFWNGVTTPANGYVLYINKPVQGPSVHVANNDADLMNYAVMFGGANISTTEDALYFFHNWGSDKICTNINHPDIVTDGLTMSLDAGFSVSYPRSGDTWYDTSFSGNNATLVNSPQFSLSGGGVFVFSATNSNYATIPVLPKLTDFTLEAWVYFNSLPTSNTFPAIMTESYNGGNYVNYAMGVLNVPWDGKVCGGFYNNGWQITSGFTPVINQWYHIVIAYSNQEIIQYVDGAVQSTKTTSVGPDSDGLEGRLMKRWDDNDFIDGCLGISRIYSRKLSPSEVLQNYQSTKPRYQNQVDPYTELDGLAAYLRGYMPEFRNPNFFPYRLDGTGVYISDGGDDMYDGGNFTTPWLVSGVNYTSSNSSEISFPFAINYANTGTTTADTSLSYVSLGYVQYNNISQVDTFHPLTVIGTRSVEGHGVGWQVGGNSGADGGGTLASSMIYNGVDINGFKVYAFYRETYNTSDPSHCNLFMLIGHDNWDSVFGTIHTFADPVINGGCGSYLYTSGAGVKNILAVQTLLSKVGGALVSSSECEMVVQNFVNRIKLYFGY